MENKEQNPESPSVHEKVDNAVENNERNENINSIVRGDKEIQSEKFDEVVLELCSACFLVLDTEQKIYCEKCKSNFHYDCALYSSDGELKCQVCEKKSKKFQRKVHDVLGNPDSHSTMIRNKIKETNYIDSLKEDFIKYKAESENKICALIKENEILRKIQENSVAKEAQRNSHNQPENISANNIENSHSSPNITSVDVMNKILERQIFQDERAYNRELPVVNKIGTDWLVMYKSYENSKKLFSDSENVIRLQKAIKGEDVIKLGGPNLFSIETYDESMHKINKLINRPQDLLRDNLKEILNIEVSHDKKDRQSLIDYIIAINHYANLQNKIGTPATRCDPTMIEQLSNKLPYHLNEKWQSICVGKEFNNELISIVHLSIFLEEKLAVLMRLKSCETIEEKHEKIEENKSENSSQKSFNKPYYSSNKTHEKSAYKFKCWVHQSNDHFVSQCPKAKELSGYEVISIAKQLGVCTLCCKEEFTGKGHQCRNPPAPECRYHPNERHWHIVCPTRPPQNRETKFENNNNKNNNHGNFSAFPEGSSQSLPQLSNQTCKEKVDTHSNMNFNQNSSQALTHNERSQQENLHIPEDVDLNLYKGLNNNRHWFDQ